MSAQVKKGLFTGLFVIGCAMMADAQPIATTTRQNSAPGAKDEPLVNIDEMPVAPYDLGTYLGERLIYPDTARKKGIEGRVILNFIVEKNGKIDSVRVVKGIGYGCDEEALRIVKQMPPWKPGKQNGVPVRVWFTLPIRFQLTD